VCRLETRFYFVVVVLVVVLLPLVVHSPEIDDKDEKKAG
jgi:hypothetical protein